ncbi:MAG: ABC transporter permease [Flexilinea sp.]
MDFSNGVNITKVNIPPLLATIGMSTAIRGLAYIVCDGATIFGLPPSFSILGRGNLWIIPIPIIIAFGISLIFLIVQKKTSFSIYNYAIGGNSNAAYLSGIKTERHVLSLYMIMGLLTGLNAFLNASRLGVGIASAGSTIDFDAVTAVVLGGTSIKGGSGKIQGTLLGCIIIGVISNGMMILNVHSFAQQLAKGLILLLAIGIDTFSKKREI